MENSPNNDEIIESGLFARATHFDTLWTAWEKVRDNQGAAGGDGITVQAFEARAHNNVSRLSHSLRTGRYSPGPTRRTQIPKRTGGYRPLDIPCVVDRVAQSAVALVLSEILEPEFEDSSFAYRPRRGVADAVARIASLRRDGYRWIVEGDIVRYFERISHERLINQVESHTDDIRLVDLISLWLEHHSHDGRGVPQGSPLSPLLANLYLDKVDEDIERRGVRLVRFADDFVLLCRDEAKAGAALERMRTLLLEHDLELHPEKTRLVPFDQGLRFLGHLFVRSMVLREVRLDDEPLLPAKQISIEPEGAGDEEAESAIPPGRWAPRHRVLYLLEAPRTLSAYQEAFVVAEGEQELLKLPQWRVDRIEVGPNVEIEVSALDLAAASDTVIVRVNGHGRALGSWRGNNRGKAKLQLAQASLVLDQDRRAALARVLAAGRVRNQRTLLKRLDRGVADPAVAKATARLGRLLRTLERSAGDVANSMGLEGQAASIYWPTLAKMVGDSTLASSRRVRRTGHDAFNIVLDLMSSLLTRDVLIAIERVGLHPGFPVLHGSSDYSDPLAYDLMEEFRAPISEAATVSLFRRGIVNEDHFAIDENGWRLLRDGYAATVRGYEAWVNRPIKSHVSDEKTLWRGLMEEQARSFAETCEDQVPYRPYAMDY